MEQTERELFNLGLSGKLTKEQRDYYVANYLSNAEKAVGKPFFEMNDTERLQVDAYEYNHITKDSTDGYNCKICGNKGDIMVIKDNRKYYRTCECQQIREVRQLMKDCGLFDLLKVYSFSNFDKSTTWQKLMYDTAIKYVNDNTNRWFCITGQSGAGKSFICTAIVGELLKRNIPCLFISWITESTLLKQHVNNYEFYTERINRLKEVQGLYIDDFFKGDNETKPTPADIRIAIDILNYRYNKAKMTNDKRYVTIISSERTIAQIISFDAAIGGRIYEMSNPEYFLFINGAYKNQRVVDD